MNKCNAVVQHHKLPITLNLLKAVKDFAVLCVQINEQVAWAYWMLACAPGEPGMCLINTYCDLGGSIICKDLKTKLQRSDNKWS